VRLFKTILLLMIVVSVVPTTMVGWLSVSDTRELLIGDAQELAQERVKQLRMKAEAVVDEPLRGAMGVARVPQFFSLPITEQRAHIAAILNQQRDLTALTLFGPDRARISGLQAFAVKDMPPTEVAAHEERATRLLPSGGVRYSDVYPSIGTGLPALTVAFAVDEPARGYAAAEISLARLPQMLAHEKVGSVGFAYVVDRHGRLVASTPALGATQTGADLSPRPAVAHFIQTFARSPNSEAFHVGNFGQGSDAVVAAYSVMPELGWAIVSEQPVRHAYKQVEATQKRLAIALAGALAIALGLAALFSRKITQPLKGFTTAALDIARGKFGAHVEVKAKNELSDLAQTFSYMSSALQAYDQETKGLYASLEEGYLETILALANSIDSKDPYTRGHSQRVGDIAVEIGREMGLTGRQLKHLQYGGILHDIGKIGIPEAILCKQTRLNEEEMVVMRHHPSIGDTIVRPISFLSTVRAAVRNHHERWDGTGYPDALKGEDIPLVARIVNCADTFDACTSTRPYQQALPLEQALAILEKLRGNQLDPSVLDALRRVVEKKVRRAADRRPPIKVAS